MGFYVIIYEVERYGTPEVESYHDHGTTRTQQSVELFLDQRSAFRVIMTSSAEH